MTGPRRLLRRLYLAVAGRRQPKGGRHRRPVNHPAFRSATEADMWAAFVAAHADLDKTLEGIGRRHKERKQT